MSADRVLFSYRTSIEVQLQKSKPSIPSEYEYSYSSAASTGDGQTLHGKERVMVLLTVSSALHQVAAAIWRGTFAGGIKGR